MCCLHQRAAFTSVCLQFAIEQIAAHVHDIFLFLVSDSLALQMGFGEEGLKALLDCIVKVILVLFNTP